MLTIETLMQVLTPLNSNDQTVNLEINLDLENGVENNFAGFYTMVDSDITRTLNYPQTVASHVNEGTTIRYNIVNGTRIYTCTITNSNPIDDISPEDITYREICELEGQDGGGCTDPSAINYNPNALYDNGSCIYSGSNRIRGCTDPNATNYNPEANIDDGSCIYLNGPQVDIIRGCTNELAINYNPNANLNDGSCVFLSGCTIEIASNYDPNAVIDDGSCECNEYQIDFLSGETLLNVDITEEQGCVSLVKLDIGVSVNCESILMATVLDEVRLTDKLNGLSIDLIATQSGQTYFSQTVFDDNNNVFTNQGTETCDLFYELYEFENNINCKDDSLEAFTKRLFKVEVIVPLISGITNFGFSVNNFNFDHTIYIDNVEIISYCEKEIKKCFLLPKKYGFDLERLYTDGTTKIYEEHFFNSKEITLRVNPIYQINNDVIEYFKKYGYYGKRDLLYNLNEEQINNELINVKRHKINNDYFHLKDIYEIYKDNQGSCSLPNRKLNSDYVNFIYDKIDVKWRKNLKNLIDPTLIGLKSDYYYTNNYFCRSKHKYKKYTLDKGCDAEAELTFELILDDPCISDTVFKSRFDIIDNINGNCVPCENSGITYSYFDDGVSESGRMVQYTGDTFSGITQTINYDSYVFSDCYENEICPEVNIEITGFRQEGKLLLAVDFITTGVNDVDEIEAYVNGVLQAGTVQFSPTSQTGQYLYSNHNSEVDILLVATNECGTDSDIINDIKP